MKKVAAFALSLIFLFSAASPVFAAEFKLEPEDFLVQATAGQTILETVLIKNLSPTAKNLKLTWEDYSLPESEFTSREDLEKHSISFATISQTNLELQPFSTAPVEIEFKIPKGTAPADYYGRLLVLDQDSKAQTDFTIRLLGKIEEKIDLTRIFTKGSSLIIEIANNGNQTSNLSLTVTIQSLLGQTIQVTPVKQQIKAAQHKNLSIEAGDLLPGYYQAKISLEYGSGRTKSSFYSFWVHPELFLIGGALIFIIVVLLVSPFKRRVRK